MKTALENAPRKNIDEDDYTFYIRYLDWSHFQRNNALKVVL